jgi:hypothetical protein
MGLRRAVNRPRAAARRHHARRSQLTVATGHEPVTVRAAESTRCVQFTERDKKVP